MLEKYPNDVKHVFKNFPLRRHKFAFKAAVSALAAERQGKFWEFHDQLFKDYKRLNDNLIDQIAQSVGLDLGRFKKDQKDPKLLAKVREDMSDAARAGVRGTPTIFINGKLLKNRTLAGFSTVIEGELKKIRRRRP